MKRVNEIWNHPVYQTHLTKSTALGKERKFCRHTVEHFWIRQGLLTYIRWREGLCIPKDLIYAAALLHDIGRHLQYEEGTPHEKASAGIAAQILPECGFTEAECERILDAVLSHRRSAGRSDFGRIFTGLTKCRAAVSPARCRKSATGRKKRKPSDSVLTG